MSKFLKQALGKEDLDLASLKKPEPAKPKLNPVDPNELKRKWIAEWILYNLTYYDDNLPKWETAREQKVRLHMVDHNDRTDFVTTAYICKHWITFMWLAANDYVLELWFDCSCLYF